MSQSATRPVLIGAAQVTIRDAEPESAASPLDLLARVALEAAESTGVGTRWLDRLDTIGLTDAIGWSPRNGPRLLGERIGARPAVEIACELGGETSVGLTNEVAGRISSGETKLAFVGGCHNLRTLLRARDAGLRLEWERGGDGEPVRFGKQGDGTTAAEEAVGLKMPIEIYPLFENALRAARGQSLAEHRRAMGELFAPFTEVAARNPHAWFRTPRSAEELVEVTPSNRMICFPYTKLLNAIMTTDQAAGLLIASEEMADELGIPESGRVHWRGGAVEVEDPWFVSERPSFAEAPALATCHRRALARAGLALDEIELIDVYSCFPSAVAMTCEMLGLAQDDPRGLTLTGGLPYAGGPGNSYGMHALAAAFEALRDGRGEHALLTGNGWYLTKHSATVLSRQPGPPTPAVAPDEDAAEAPPRATWKAEPVRLAGEARGPGRVETYTIVHGRDGRPERGIVIGRLAESGERFLANTPSDPELLEELEREELVGTTGRVDSDGDTPLFQPG